MDYSLYIFKSSNKITEYNRSLLNRYYINSNKCIVTILDVLQSWTFNKKTERVFKAVCFYSNLSSCA